MTDIPTSATHVVRYTPPTLILSARYLIDRRRGDDWVTCLAAHNLEGLSIAILGLLKRAAGGSSISVWDVEAGRFIVGDVGQLDDAEVAATA